MGTQTSTAIANADPPRAIHAGLLSKTVQYNSADVTISASATTILMARIPNKATIIDYVADQTSGAATCPADVGISGVDLSAFSSAQAKGSVHRATKGVPYDVSLTDTADDQFITVAMTLDNGTNTASTKANLTVIYTMDK